MAQVPPGDPVEQTYRQFHGSINAINSILEFYYNQIQELRVKNQMLTKNLDEINRKLKEFEPPKKK